jgi:hypothetical protein
VGSACYVYAIVSRDTPLPSAGIDGVAAALAMVPWRKLAAVIGPIDDDVASLTMDAVLRHEAVVEAVRRQGRALPVRFGTVFRDATSVATALAERYESLETDLDRVGDKVELSLTALWAPGGPYAAPEGAAPEGRAARNPTAAAHAHNAGARYLQARAAELRGDEALTERARAVARELDKLLGKLVLAQRTSLLPTAGIAVRTAYLLDPAGVSAFKTAVDVIRATSSELRVLLTGPWPPYSFVGRSESEGGATADGRLAALGRLLADALEGAPADRPRREWTTSN